MRLLVQNAFNVPRVQVRANACAFGAGHKLHLACQFLRGIPQFRRTSSKSPENTAKHAGK